MVIEPLADEFHYLRLPRFDGSRLHDSLRNGGGSENARIVMARRDDVRLQMLLLPEYEHAISLGRLDCHTLASYHFARNCVRLANSLGLRSAPSQTSVPPADYWRRSASRKIWCPRIQGCNRRHPCLLRQWYCPASSVIASHRRGSYIASRLPACPLRMSCSPPH